MTLRILFHTIFSEEEYLLWANAIKDVYTFQGH